MKKIISLLASASLMFSLVSFSTVHAAAGVNAKVTAELNATKDRATIQFIVDTTEAYFKSVQFEVGIPATTFNITTSTWANKATAKDFLIPSNPAGTATKFNPNNFTQKYTAFGDVIGGQNYDQKTEKLIYTAAIGDGAEIPADGVLVEFDLPVSTTLSSNVDLTVLNFVMKTTNYTTDTTYGVGDAGVIGAIDAAATKTNGVLEVPSNGPTVTADAVITKDSTIVSGGKNYGFGGEVEANGESFTGLKFTFDNQTTQKEYTWDFGTVLNANTTFGLNLMGVPAGITVTATIEPIVADK